MRVWGFLLIFVLLSTGIPVLVHSSKYGAINGFQGALAFFLTLNTLICFWEIGLGLYIQDILAEFKRLETQFGKKPFDAVIDFFFLPCSAKQIFSFKFWTRVWSTYSLYDPSYSNKQSFGFFIDVGNGWYTLPSGLLFLIGMSFDIMTPFTMGVLGLIMFHTAFYGTCIYFLSYVFNGRYKGRGFAEVVLFVGLSNGLWFVFPLLGMYTSYQLLAQNSFALFRQ